MARTRYLVAYDIREDRRLRQVHRTVKGFGWAMQYSVFVCDLDDFELLRLKAMLVELIHHGEDSVAFIDLGPPAQRGTATFDFLGVRPALPSQGSFIL